MGSGSQMLPANPIINVGDDYYFLEVGIGVRRLVATRGCRGKVEDRAMPHCLAAAVKSHLLVATGSTSTFEEPQSVCAKLDIGFIIHWWSCDSTSVQRKPNPSTNGLTRDSTIEVATI
jgi:hypothetical protein